MCFGKKVANRLRHDGAHVVDLQQLLHACGHQCIELAKVPGQVFGCGLAHMANAQAVEKTRQRGALGTLQGIEQVAGRFFCHALQAAQGGQIQPVQVGQTAHHVALYQLIDQLLAQAFNVECAALRIVQQRLLALRRAKQPARAAVVHLARFAQHVAATHRALARHTKVGHIARTRPRHHAHHFGNHVARAAHDHLVAQAHAFFADFKQVVQRGIGHRDAANKHRLQARHGREFAGAAHLDVDGLDARHHFLRRVFVRHGPARFARLKT